MFKYFCFLFLFFVTLTSAQQDSSQSDGANSGIVYGEDHAFGITAPQGWILDNSSGVNQGLHAVFYPIGGSWKKSKAVMYANTASKKVKGNETLKKLLDYDIGQFEQNNPGVKVINSDSLVTKDHKRAVVKLFKYSQYEAVAYIDEETIISMLVLTARTESDFNLALPSFRELVSSYFFIAKDVEIKD